MHFVLCNQEMLKPSLKQLGVSSGHFIGGAFDGPAERVVPAVLEEFRRMAAVEVHKGAPLIVAVASDVLRFPASGELRPALANTDRFLEHEYARAKRVAKPLADENPDRKIVVMGYYEETPDVLRNFLKRERFLEEPARNKLSLPISRTMQPVSVS